MVIFNFTLVHACVCALCLSPNRLLHLGAPWALEKYRDVSGSSFFSFFFFLKLDDGSLLNLHRYTYFS